MPRLAIDRGYVVGTLTDLVRINSVNPSIAADGPGEAEIAGYISSSLARVGLSTAIHEPKPGRATAVGTLAGTGGGRSLMLNGHADTVGIDGMADPFAAVVRGGKLYGRGAHDMKGSLAACIGAAKALVDAVSALRGILVIAAVADEEYGSLGTADLIGRYRVDAAIVTEPTNLEICLAHKGYIWFEVETMGRAAHGSRFTEGIDANMRMGRFLAGLDELEQALRAGPPHPLVGPPSLHAAMLKRRQRPQHVRGRLHPQDRAAHNARRDRSAGAAEIQAHRRPARGRGLRRSGPPLSPFSCANRSRSRPTRGSSRRFAVRHTRCWDDSRPSSAIRPGWTRRCWPRPASRRS